jgi:hypothetical protein
MVNNAIAPPNRGLLRHNADALRRANRSTATLIATDRLRRNRVDLGPVRSFLDHPGRVPTYGWTERPS